MAENLSDGGMMEDRDATAVNTWATGHAAAMLAAASSAVALKSAVPIASIAAISFAIFWHRHRRVLSELKPYGGVANYLTALRLVLILLAALLLVEISPLGLLLLFSINVALDTADGRLARRNNQATKFGAAFDRETDAAFVLVAYMYFFLTQSVPAWILLPGILPYVYRLFVWRFQDPSVHERRQRFATVLAGVNYFLLLLALAAPADLRLYVLIISTSIVIGSFALSFWNLYLNEHPVS